MPRFQRDVLVDSDDILNYLDVVGAATVKELKEFYEVDSRSMRRSLFTLGLEDEINLIVLGGKPMPTTYWCLWPRGKRGQPNPYSIRAEAQGRNTS